MCPIWPQLPHLRCDRLSVSGLSAQWCAHRRVGLGALLDRIPVGVLRVLARQPPLLILLQLGDLRLDSVNVAHVSKLQSSRGRETNAFLRRALTSGSSVGAKSPVSGSDSSMSRRCRKYALTTAGSRTISFCHLPPICAGMSSRRNRDGSRRTSLRIRTTLLAPTPPPRVDAASSLSGDDGRLKLDGDLDPLLDQSPGVGAPADHGVSGLVENARAFPRALSSSSTESSGGIGLLSDRSWACQMRSISCR